MPRNEKSGLQSEGQPREPRPRRPARRGLILAVITIALCAISWTSCRTRGICVPIDWKPISLTLAPSSPEERARRILEKHPLVGKTHNHKLEPLLTAPDGHNDFLSLIRGLYKNNVHDSN